MTFQGLFGIRKINFYEPADLRSNIAQYIIFILIILSDYLLEFELNFEST